MAQQPLRVLLIEDNPADARLIRETLADVPDVRYEVTHADTLRSGLAQLREAPSDVVLLDLRLPDGEGLDSLRTVQAEASDRAVVITSGLDDEALATRAVRSGAQDYLVKGRIAPDVLERSLRYAHERKAAENELRSHAQAIVESVTIGLCVLHRDTWTGDAALRLNAANEAFAELAGAPAEQLRGRRLVDVLPGLEATRVPSVCQAALRDGQRREGLEIDLPAGAVPAGVFEARVLPLPDGSVSLALDDVTERVRADQERRRLEQDLRQAQKMESLGVLAGGIAHDFNELLQGILGNLGLSVELAPEGSELRQRVGQALDAGARAAELTRQLLVYTGREQRIPRPVDLSRLVRDMTRLLRASIDRNAALSFDLAEAPPTIEADPVQLRQVVLNLVTNASEALEGREGHIRVRTGALEASREWLAATYLQEDLEAGRYVYLEVADDGPGMDEEARARLFDPFYSRKAEGRGLGLASVLGIVRGHRGALDLDTVQGEGTAVRVLWPVTDRPAEASALEQPAPVSTEAVDQVVLVADDEPRVQQLARAMLERAGYRVLTAGDGEEAVRLFTRHAHRIGSVLLDWSMPQLGGAESFRLMREIRSDLPVVVSTGYGEQEVYEAIGEPDHVAMLSKPYRPHQLLAKLQAVAPERG